MGLDLRAPDHTTLSRRGRHLDLSRRRVPKRAGLHLIIDSSGLSIVGEGEWATAKQGRRGRRGWKKLHLGVDPTGVIVAHALTEGIDAPICQDTRLGCLRDVSAHAEVCHHTLVDFTGEEAFEAAADLASGPAARRPAGDVVDRRLVEPHADGDRTLEGGVRVSVPAPIETMPAGRHPGRSRDRAGPAQLRKGGF